MTNTKPAGAAPGQSDAPLSQEKPVAWVVFTENGNVRLWGPDRGGPQAFADAKGLICEPVFRGVAQPSPDGDFYLVPRTIIDQFPEINISNYDHDDVCALHSWGCEVVTNANPAPPPSPAAPAQAWQPIETSVIFMLDRLEEFDPGESDAEREFHGHVAPAIARLRSAISSTHCQSED